MTHLSHSQPHAAGKLPEMMFSHSTTSFDRFYKNPTPIGALDLAISDAIHGKQSQEFYSELVKARDLLNSHAQLLAQNESLRAALEALAILAAQRLAGDDSDENSDSLRAAVNQADKIVSQ